MPRLTEAQLEARKTTMGSSDVATLICGGKYGAADPWSVFNEKHGITEREEESVEMWLGHEAETLMVRLYERETKHRVRPGTTHHHRDMPWATATIDGEIDQRVALTPIEDGPAGYRYEPLNRALECKLVGSHRMFDWDEMIEDGLPHKVRVQVAWQCLVTGFEEIDVMALLGGTKPRIWTVRRDRELETLILGAVIPFYEKCIVAKEPPEVDGTEECRAYLEAHHSHTVRGELAPSTPEIDLLAYQRIAAQRQEVASKAAKEKFDNLLRVAIGDAPGFRDVTKAYSVGWRVGKGGVRRYTFTAKGDPNE